jgi:glycosyltransferase involved in cell wall biosynthesis
MTSGYYSGPLPHRKNRGTYRIKIDIILSQHPALVSGQLAGVPVVFDYLDHLEESASIYYPGSAFGKLVKSGVSRITRYNLRHARSVITVTEELAQFLRGLGVNDIAVIPNGVDTQVLKPIPIEEAKMALGLKGQVIGYVGSLEHWWTWRL